MLIRRRRNKKYRFRTKKETCFTSLQAAVLSGPEIRDMWLDSILNYLEEHVKLYGTKRKQEIFSTKRIGLYLIGTLNYVALEKKNFSRTSTRETADTLVFVCGIPTVIIMTIFVLDGVKSPTQACWCSIFQ